MKSRKNHKPFSNNTLTPNKSVDFSPRPFHDIKDHNSEVDKGNQTGLPFRLKAGIEHLSGVSLDDVRVNYNSDKPASVGASAYAQGRQIHVGPGQEHTLPHEAWHAAQQKQGRVKVTMKANNKGVNDESDLETEASAMGYLAGGNETRVHLGSTSKQAEKVSNPQRPTSLINGSQVIQLMKEDDEKTVSKFIPSQTRPSRNPLFTGPPALAKPDQARSLVKNSSSSSSPAAKLGQNRLLAVPVQQSAKFGVKRPFGISPAHSTSISYPSSSSSLFSSSLSSSSPSAMSADKKQPRSAQVKIGGAVLVLQQREDRPAPPIPADDLNDQLKKALEDRPAPPIPADDLNDQLKKALEDPPADLQERHLQERLAALEDPPADLQERHLQERLAALEDPPADLQERHLQERLAALDATPIPADDLNDQLKKALEDPPAFGPQQKLSYGKQKQLKTAGKVAMTVAPKAISAGLNIAGHGGTGTAILTAAGATVGGVAGLAAATGIGALVTSPLTAANMYLSHRSMKKTEEHIRNLKEIKEPLEEEKQNFSSMSAKEKRQVDQATPDPEETDFKRRLAALDDNNTEVDDAIKYIIKKKVNKQKIKSQNRIPFVSSINAVRGFIHKHTKTPEEREEKHEHAKNLIIYAHSGDERAYKVIQELVGNNIHEVMVKPDGWKILKDKMKGR